MTISSDQLRFIHKPTIFKFVSVLFLLSWEYFYSYLGIKLSYLGYLGEYLGLGLGEVNWNNYFIRSGFMLILWLIVALLIFFAIWVSEYISVTKHNNKIKKDFINQSESNYADKLMNPLVEFRYHFINQLIIIGAITLYLAGLFLFSDFLEFVRQNLTSMVVNNLLENSVEVSYDSSWFLVISFFFMAIPWYFYSGLVEAIYRFGLDRKKKTEIADEHFAVVVDESEPEEAEE